MEKIKKMICIVSQYLIQNVMIYLHSLIMKIIREIHFSIIGNFFLGPPAGWGSGVGVGFLILL